MTRLATFALLALTLPSRGASADDPHAANDAIGRGINLGNALEAPEEGAWGMRLEADFFPTIRKAGFDSVRIPIRWSSHASKTAPYAIDPEFFQRVDWALDQAEKAGLAAIINIHHFEELYDDPETFEPMLAALWEQIGERYRDRPDSVVFELLNEPHGNLTSERWDAMVPKALAAVRVSNPVRAVIVGPGNWNNVRALDSLELPADDRHLIVTFHYYEPFHFTHQGAEWAEGSTDWLGETWTGTPEQLGRLRDDFDHAARWGREHDRPIFLGEFGAYSKAPMSSRATWTEAVSSEAASRGFSTAYWEFGSGFGAFDRQAGEWIAPLRDALIKGDEPDRAKH